MSNTLVHLRRQLKYKIAYGAVSEIPVLDIPMPRKIESLHQIELSSRCNLRCVYCPSPKLQRPKVDMSEEHFLRALEWVDYLVKRGTQIEINMAASAKAPCTRSSFGI